MAIDIEKKLSEAGYKMLGADEDKEDLILSILNTEDIRYLKAIPFLIYNYNIDLEKVYFRTKKKKLLAQIICISRKIFRENKIDNPLPDISEEGNFNEEEFRQEFEMQKLASEKVNLMVDKQKIYAERDLQMWVSRIFTKKERQIIKRILELKPVSRTDYEYYSRKTRKKLNSIINLQDFAKTLSSRPIKYDADLFRLKKLLEMWLEKKEGCKEASVQKFFISDETLSIFFLKSSNYPTEQRFIRQIKLKEINDTEILRLLDRYKEQDFT